MHDVALRRDGTTLASRPRRRDDRRCVGREDDGRLAIVCDGGEYRATVVALGEERHVFCGGAQRRLRLVDPLAHAGEDEAHGGHLTAPMSGTVIAVMVKAGDRVAKGAPLMILEAMKMEHTIVAPADGIVACRQFPRRRAGRRRRRPRRRRRGIGRSCRYAMHVVVTLSAARSAALDGPLWRGPPGCAGDHGASRGSPRRTPSRRPTTWCWRNPAAPCSTRSRRRRRVHRERRRRPRCCECPICRATFRWSASRTREWRDRCPDYVLAAALRSLQRMDAYARQQQETRWDQQHERAPAEIACGRPRSRRHRRRDRGGAGRAGLRGAWLARRRSDASTASNALPAAIDLDAFLAGLDFLVNALPLTPATTGLVDRAPPSGGLPTARTSSMSAAARTMVDADLLALLDSGKLSGATLDVFTRGAAAAGASVLAPSARHAHAARLRADRSSGGGGADRGEDRPPRARRSGDGTSSTAARGY